MFMLASRYQTELFPSQGLGTAIGELPPYFMARGARLSGKHEEELHELEEILMADQTLADSQGSAKSESPCSMHKRIEIFLHHLVTRAGFFGILLCASVSFIFN